MKGSGIKIMSIIAVVVLGYVTLLCLIYIFQSKLIFLPSYDIIITPAQAGIQADDVWIDSDDGVRLHGWHFPAAEAEYVVVLSHGNAGNISNRIDIAKLLNEIGFAVLLYDYRGYGKSSGKPNEEGLYRDIEAVVNYLKTESGYSEKQMIMYGRSMGGAVASYAATRFDVSGLVLDSAFRNVKTMVGDLYPFVPSFLATYELSAEKYLQKISGIPVMVMHSPNDNIVGISHAEYLYELAEEPKMFVELRGGHNNNFFVSTDLIEKNWRNFKQMADDLRKRAAKEE